MPSTRDSCHTTSSTSSWGSYHDLRTSVKTASQNAKAIMGKWNKLVTENIEPLSGDLEHVIEALQHLEEHDRYQGPLEELQKSLEESRKPLDETLENCKAYLEKMAREVEA